MTAATVGGTTPGGLDVLEARLATLNGFRETARDELKEQGGIDPELQMEIRKLDEAIRAVNLLIFQAKGNKIKRSGAQRERCPTCERYVP